MAYDDRHCLEQAGHLKKNIKCVNAFKSSAGGSVTAHVCAISVSVIFKSIIAIYLNIYF